MYILLPSSSSFYIDMGRDDCISARVTANRVDFSKYEIIFYLDREQVFFLPRPCSFVISYYDDDNICHVVFRDNKVHFPK